MGRGETRVSDNEGVRTEERKSKGKREKVRKLTMREREGTIKLCFPEL